MEPLIFYFKEKDMEFLKNFFKELLLNGKLLIGFLLLQIPHLTNFPGVWTAIQTAMSDKTLKSYLEVAIQILMAIAAAHRVVKISRTASLQSKIEKTEPKSHHKKNH